MLKARDFVPDKQKSMSSEGEAMSADQSVKRDERTVAVENASFRWPFAFLLFALLADVVYRSLFRNEAAWDLMGLVIVSSSLSTVYQARQRIWGGGWLWKMTLIGFVAAIVAAIIAGILAVSKSM
jgi:hypothetical protein